MVTTDTVVFLSFPGSIAGGARSPGVPRLALTSGDLQPGKSRTWEIARAGPHPSQCAPAGRAMEVGPRRAREVGSAHKGAVPLRSVYSGPRAHHERGGPQ
jgi:hypothetical protein